MCPREKRRSVFLPAAFLRNTISHYYSYRGLNRPANRFLATLDRIFESELSGVEGAIGAGAASATVDNYFVCDMLVAPPAKRRYEPDSRTRDRTHRYPAHPRRAFRFCLFRPPPGRRRAAVSELEGEPSSAASRTTPMVNAGLRTKRLRVLDSMALASAGKLSSDTTPGLTDDLTHTPTGSFHCL